MEPFQDKILLTGKYLNAVNVTIKMNSGHKEKALATIAQYQIKEENFREIIFSVKDDHYKEIIDMSYDNSNKLLLGLLLKEFKLVGRLKYYYS